MWTRRLAVLLCLWAPVFAQADAPPPSETEIAGAYRSRGQAGGSGPLRIPVGRARDVRGWALKFKQVSRANGFVVTTSRYLVIARKDQACATYLLVDTLPLTNATVKPALTVERQSLRTCR